MRERLTEDRRKIAEERMADVKAKLETSGAAPIVVRLSEITNADEDPEWAIWSYIIPRLLKDYDVMYVPTVGYTDLTISRRVG